MFNKNQNNCITDASRQGVVVGAKGAWHVCFFCVLRGCFVDMALCMRPAYKSATGRRATKRGQAAEQVSGSKKCNRNVAAAVAVAVAVAYRNDMANLLHFPPRIDGAIVLLLS